MRASIAMAVLGIFLLSGCLANGSAKVQPSTAPSAAAMDSPATEPAEPTNVFVPKFHTHDYWNDRAELALFIDYAVKLGEHPDQEIRTVGNNVIVGYKEFTSASDGADAGTSDKTDTVYQGTKEILFQLDWAPDSQIKGLTFYYKSAAGPIFTAIPQVESGKPYVIPIRKGMADMPHQLDLSRWRFALEAYDPSLDSLPAKAYVARGDVKVNMKLIRGDETAIDPPHPYFFTNGPTRYAGEVNQTVATSVLANATANGQTQQVAAGSKLSGWHVENRHIIPWETTRMHATLYYNYTGPLKPVNPKLALQFTDASGPKAKYPKALSEDAGKATYEFAVSEAMTDSPYAQSSDWTWGVFPVTPGAEGSGGEFEGNLHIVLVAIQDANTTGRGMGN